MKVPILLFDEIMLRDINIKDAKDMFEYGSDPDVTQFLNWGPYQELGEAKEAIINYFLKRPLKGLPVGYAIYHLKDKKMIGTVDFHTIHEDGSVELGYCLNKKYWNLHIMTRCVQKLIQVGFDVLGYDKITCGHLNDNIASKKVIIASGMKFDYTNPNGYRDRFTGEMKETQMYAITRSDYYANKQG